MQWNLFIVPLTAIFVQIMKPYIKDNRLLPALAVVAGAVMGACFAFYYGADFVEHIVGGIVYGASASGVYDLIANASNTVKKTEE